MLISLDANPVVKEWFVYPGNSLQQPELVQPKRLPGRMECYCVLELELNEEYLTVEKYVMLIQFSLRKLSLETQADQLT